MANDMADVPSAGCLWTRSINGLETHSKAGVTRYTLNMGTSGSRRADICPSLTGSRISRFLKWRRSDMEKVLKCPQSDFLEMKMSTLFFGN